MATKTTNYNLTKPAYDEDADIAVINANMDIIDAKMKEIEETGGSGGGGGASAWSDITGKPFESIGSGLSVSNGVLSATGGGGGGNGVNYSTEEQVIGTWIDGKPLYQKSFDFGALPSGGAKEIPHNIDNVDNIWVYDGFVFSRDGYFLPLVHADDIALTSVWEFSATRTYVRCVTYKDRSTLSAYMTIRYTKTTD